MHTITTLVSTLNSVDAIYLVTFGAIPAAAGVLAAVLRRRPARLPADHETAAAHQRAAR